MTHQTHTLPLPPDSTGPNRALAFQFPGEGKVGVLYVPGFSDCFFQTHVAEAVLETGCQFWTLEPRKCGFAKLPGQPAHHIEDFSEYREEIDWVLELMASNGVEKVVCLAHSAGSLTALDYAHNGRHQFDAVVLNSPFLDFNVSEVEKKIGMRLIGLLASLAPRGAIRYGLTRFYGDSIHKSFKGEWDFDLGVKPVPAHPSTFGFIRAVMRAHERNRSAPPLKVPLMILYSDRSWKGSSWDEGVRVADAVLNVEDMKRLGPSLAEKVEMVELPGALHDVFLSSAPVREKGLEALKSFLRRI